MRQLKLTQDQYTLVDDDVYEWASKYKWYTGKNGNTAYVVRKYYIDKISKKRRNMALHHCIIGFPLNKKQVDHIDGDGLNNQRSNLKIVTVRGNSQNRRERRIGKKSSKYVGVFWHKRIKKWQVSLQLNGKSKHLGYFDDELLANEIYTNAVKNLIK